MQPIGMMDSGVGGLAVLSQAVHRLPEQSFLFLGDLPHAPYGGRSREEIVGLAVNAADKLARRGVSALVVACNTATSAAIGVLRQRYPFPVVGMEPALKPAITCGDRGRILVMATPATLELDKFRELLHRYEEYRDRVVPLPCPELSRLVETAGPDSPAVEAYLRCLFEGFSADGVSGVVLGCTHYIFLREAVQRVLGPVALYDGVDGTVRQLARSLALPMGDFSGDWRTRVEFLPENTREDEALLERFMDDAWRREA